MNEINNDWLDAVLHNRPASDDGFAERVIAIDRAQRRGRLLFLAVVGVVVAGLSLSCAAVLVVRALARWNTAAFFEEHDAEARWFADNRADFRLAFSRLDALPALTRRSGHDARTLLDPIVAELEGRGPRATNCVDEVSNKALRDVSQSRCDTSFINGIAAYDEWRHVGHVWPVETTDTVDGVYALVEVARTHLRHAADLNETAFAAAATDVEALARLTLGHSSTGALLFKVVNEEQKLALARGRSGGFVPAVDSADLGLIESLWLGAVSFAGAAATDDDVAFVARGRSVLSCAVRADAQLDLTLQEEFLPPARTARNRAFDPDGCAVRLADVGGWYLCGDEPTLGCRAAQRFLHLPGVKSLVARTVEGARFRPRFSSKRAKT